MSQIIFNKQSQPSSPSTGLVSIYVDSTTGRLASKNENGAITYYEPGDGWIASGATWSYSSADSPTFVISINADMTGTLMAGMRIKLTQTTVKYFIVTVVGSYSGGATLVTVYGGTDYTLANAAISATYYSPYKAPFGFPLSPDKWTVETLSTADSAKTSPVQNTWYGGSGLTPTGPSIDIPIGVWRVEYFCDLSGVGNLQGPNCFGTLSTANNTQSDADFTIFVACFFPSAAATNSVYGPATKAKILTLAAKTTYYLNVMTNNTGQSQLYILGGVGKTIIRAICAYL